MDFHSPGDVVFIVNPASDLYTCSMTSHISLLSSIDSQAEIILPILLEFFTKGVGTTSWNSTPKPQYAPWKWGTEDVELAKAMERRLKSVGVRKELCEVHTGDENAIAIERERWKLWYDGVAILSNLVCNKCAKTSSSGGGRLLICGRCRWAEYCSQECQKADRKEHKNSCKHLSRMGSIKISHLSVLEFYQHNARNTRAACLLAEEINSNLPGRGGCTQEESNLHAPIRRLVATGKDTVANFTTLLGPHAMFDIKLLWEYTRMSILLQPPPGSLLYCLNACLDKGCPPWTPREASPAEQAEIREIREMQELILLHMGSRSMTTLNTSDEQVILTNNFGSNRSEA